MLIEYSKVFREITTHYSHVTIVIDTLDECDDANGTKKIFIEELGKLAHLHIFCTSGYLGDIAQMLYNVPRLEVRATDVDITRYLQYQILNEKDLKNFCQKGLILHDTLIEKKKG